MRPGRSDIKGRQWLYQESRGNLNPPESPTEPGSSHDLYLSGKIYSVPRKFLVSNSGEASKRQRLARPNDGLTQIRSLKMYEIGLKKRPAS